MYVATFSDGSKDQRMMSISEQLYLHLQLLPTGENGPLSSAGKFQTLMVESRDAEYTLFCEADMATDVTTLVCPLKVMLGSASSCEPLQYCLATHSFDSVCKTLTFWTHFHLYQWLSVDSKFSQSHRQSLMQQSFRLDEILQF